MFADIPGLIEGAAAGAGLGHDFLRHIERTKLLIHLLDASSDTVLDDLAVVEKELQNYGHGLPEKPRLVVLNKADILDTVARNDRMAQVEAWGEGASWMQRKPLLISAAASQGLDALREAVWRQLEADQSS